MARVLILFAHPKFERSRINKALISSIDQTSDVTIHDLYEKYPDFNIDIDKEKKLLEEHDVVVWHHPFYWYSCPPLLKQWIDLVLEYNWAYGPKGNALLGKRAISIITTGGKEEVYCREGKNNYSINEFLRPFEQTATLCGMFYLPPFTVTGTYTLTDDEVENYAQQYKAAIKLLCEEEDFHALNQADFLNNIPQLKTAIS